MAKTHKTKTFKKGRRLSNEAEKVLDEAAEKLADVFIAQISEFALRDKGRTSRASSKF